MNGLNRNRPIGAFTPKPKAVKTRFGGVLGAIDRDSSPKTAKKLFPGKFRPAGNADNIVRQQGRKKPKGLR